MASGLEWWTEYWNIIQYNYTGIDWTTTGHESHDWTTLDVIGIHTVDNRTIQDITGQDWTSAQLVIVFNDIIGSMAYMHALWLTTYLDKRWTLPEDTKEHQQITLAKQCSEYIMSKNWLIDSKDDEKDFKKPTNAFNWIFIQSSKMEMILLSKRSQALQNPTECHLGNSSKRNLRYYQNFWNQEPCKHKKNITTYPRGICQLNA